MSYKDYTLIVTRRGSKKSKLLMTLFYRVTRLTLAPHKTKEMDLEGLRALHTNLGREISLMEKELKYEART